MKMLWGRRPTVSAAPNPDGGAMRWFWFGVFLLFALPSAARAQTSITLDWTASGDDSTAGAAASYEMRYRNVAVSGTDTTGWWAAATVVPGMPAPLASGTAQSVTVTDTWTAGQTYYFILKACDDVGLCSAYSNIADTTIVANTAPSVTNPGDKTVNELVALTFTAVATDPDVGQTRSFSLDSGFPAGATISGAGAFSWTPTEAQGPGSYPITIRATDNGSPPASGTAAITVTVNEANVAPVLVAIGNKAGTIGVPVAFTAHATDADLPANGLTFSLDSGEPSGATIGGSSGIFSWTPSVDGSFPVTVRVTDDGTGTLSDFEVVTITVGVAPNQPPVLSAIGNKTVNELTALGFTASATDPDGSDVVTYSLDSGFPTGASIGSSSGVFTWTPTEAQGPASTAITVRATDNGSPNLSDFEAITVTVNEVNVAPVVTSPGNKTVNELVAIAFTVTATDSDVPANVLTWTLDSGAPTGAAINSSTGAFSWTPTEAQGPGVYPVTIRATDNGAGSLSGTAAITVTVNEVNVAPVISNPGNRTVNELDALAFTVTATDADLPANTITWSLDAGAPSGASINSSTGAFSWIPSEAQGPGVFPVTVRATDGGGAFNTATFVVTVGEVGVSPIWTNDPQQLTIPELVPWSYPVTLFDPDIPTQVLTFSLVDPLVSGLVYSSGSGLLTWTPAEAQGPGTYVAGWNVVDASSLSTGGTIALNVSEVDVAPVLSAVGNKTVSELSTLNFTALATDSDIPGNTLTYSLLAGAPAGALINSVSGAFIFTPTEAQGPGVYPITVQVSDGQITDAETISVTVLDVNTPPVVFPIGDKTVNEMTSLSFTVNAVDNDLPANSMSWSFGPGSLSGMSITAGSLGSATFSWTPGEVDGPGNYPVTVQVTDNGTPPLTGSATFNIVVNEVNRAPSMLPLQPIGKLGFNGTIGVQFTLNVKASTSDPDTPVNTLKYYMVSGFGAIDSITGLYSFTPSYGGVFAARVKATDNGVPPLSTITRNFNIIVPGAVADTLPPASVSSFTNTSEGQYSAVAPTKNKDTVGCPDGTSGTALMDLLEIRLYSNLTGDTDTTLIASAAASPGATIPISVFFPSGSVGTIWAVAADSVGNESCPSAPLSFSITTLPPGLVGIYYDNMGFTGTQFTRTDSTVYFKWDYGAPTPSMGVDTFSIRWTGYVTPPYTETYTFYVTSDDGMTVTVDGTLVAGVLTDHPLKEYKGMIDLLAGHHYPIVVEYQENAQLALAKLFWSSHKLNKAVIPASALSH